MAFIEEHSKIKRANEELRSKMHALIIKTLKENDGSIHMPEDIDDDSEDECFVSTPIYMFGHGCAVADLNKVKLDGEDVILEAMDDYGTSVRGRMYSDNYADVLSFFDACFKSGTNN